MLTSAIRFSSDSWFEDFSISLPTVVKRSLVDFESFESVNGVYVARRHRLAYNAFRYVANVYDTEDTPDYYTPIKTMITYDNGASFFFFLSCSEFINAV